MSTKVILETESHRYTFGDIETLANALNVDNPRSSTKIMFIAETIYDKNEKKFLKHRFVGHDIANGILSDAGLI